MPRTGLWFTVFVSLLFAVLPPILLLVGTLLLTESLIREFDPAVVAVLLVVGAMIWAAILAVIYARSLADDLRSFLTLAERGHEVTGDRPGDAYQHMAEALDERNRQIATLAREGTGIQIDNAPRHVVSALVTATRAVMGDDTWRAAVLRSDDPEELPPGVYLGLDDPETAIRVGDLEQWAAVTSGPVPASLIDGPWGAFAVVDASPSERLSALLYAPWEGRGDITPAERSILALVGQYAGTAIEHSLLYARVRRQAEELATMAGVQSDFLRGVTHDLQTPLTSIGALAAELKVDTDIPESARIDLDTISHQAERLRRMVSQLLVASRLEAGALTPQVEVFAVVPLIERTWSALRADQEVTLRVDGPAHLAVGDPDRMEQVLWAILDNAIKYSPPNSSIEVAVSPDGPGLRISIRDHGTGVDQSTQARAFDQFYRAPIARKLAPNGSGVGLYAARGLMEAMGGHIAMDGELGSGTLVSIWVPAERSDANPDDVPQDDGTAGVLPDPMDHAR